MLLGKLLEEIYVACGLQVLRRVATGGSTTSVIDSAIANRKGDGFYAQGANGGYVMIISQTTDRLAPEGQFGEVSAFTLSTTTPTFTIPTVTAGVAAGDVYSLMKPVIPLYEMIGRINEGLRRLPPLELADTSLTTLPDTLLYDVPLAAGAYQVLGIEIGNDADGWEDAPGYATSPWPSSIPNDLIFTSQPPTDSTTPTNKTIKIRYLAKHPTLSIYSDSVEKSVPDNVAIAVCTEAAWELMMRKRPGWYADKSKMGMWQEIQQRAAQAKAEQPIRIKPATHQPRINLSEY